MAFSAWAAFLPADAERPPVKNRRGRSNLGSRSNQGGLHGLTAGMTRRPRPLEIKAAKMPGYVDRFTDEKQTRHMRCFHCLRGQITGIDPAQRHLCFSIPLRATGHDAPPIDLIGNADECLVGHFRHAPLAGANFGNAVGQSSRQ